MTFETLQIEQEGAVRLLTLNRPKQLNVLNAQLRAELGQAVADTAADDGVRVVVLMGSGDRAFAAGADIGEMAALAPEEARRFAASGQALFSAIEALGKPTIAAVQGFALGGGCELAMACTLRIAADTAQFGQPEVELGLVPGFGGTQRLTRLVGRGRALALLLGGHRITAVEAERIGLVNRVVPAADLRAEALALAQTLAAKAPLAVRYILAAVQDGADLPLDQACDLEATLFGLSAATSDMKEGTRAFLEKRRPEFTGR
jgi:enoyl-CoA hydratase